MRALTSENLLNRVFYDAETGCIFWKKSGKKIGSTHHSGYLVCQLDKRQHLVHRVIWLYHYGCFPDKSIDHINGNKQDNRIENLRIATPSQNGANRKVSKNNISGYKGVHPSWSKWMAVIHKDGKCNYLGTFDTPELAHEAYCNAAKSLFGEFHSDGFNLKRTEAANERALARMV